MSKWRTDKPDADITVLIRSDCHSDPIRTGSFNGEQWVWANLDVEMSDRVIGWLDLHEAAAILDGKETP